MKIVGIIFLVALVALATSNRECGLILQNLLTPTPTGSVVYTCWGSSSCPSVPGTELVYSGTAAGALWSEMGGGANHLCMPSDPEYTLQFQNDHQGNSDLFGAEYESPLVATHQYNVLCAVCLATAHTTVLMLPGKTTCPTSWTKEYEGYLMTERTLNRGHHRSMYECVDKSQESVPGSQSDENGALFYHVEVNNGCTGFRCPPYDRVKELTCAVCTI